MDQEWGFSPYSPTMRVVLIEAHCGFVALHPVGADALIADDAAPVIWFGLARLLLQYRKICVFSHLIRGLALVQNGGSLYRHKQLHKLPHLVRSSTICFLGFELSFASG